MDNKSALVFSVFKNILLFNLLLSSNVFFNTKTVNIVIVLERKIVTGKQRSQNHDDINANNNNEKRATKTKQQQQEQQQQ